jgi:hypothetical protein
MRSLGQLMRSLGQPDGPDSRVAMGRASVQALPSRPAVGRDLRLDFFRGLALFCIFVDHIPNNVLALFTLQAIGFSDAAEVFILISGYTAGLVYGGAYDREGIVRATARVYARVWQLYVAHVFLFMLYMALVAHTTAGVTNQLYAEELGAGEFLKQPDVAILMALTLQFQPAFMDILPMYIVLLGLMPLLLVGLSLSPVATLGASLGLYLAVWFIGGIEPPAYPGPDQKWFFNPAAWQLLFYLGAYLAYGNLHGGHAWVGSRALFTAAVVVSAFGFIIDVSWTLHLIRPEVPALLLKQMAPYLSKTDLSIFRLVNVLALALLVVRLFSPQSPWLSTRWAAPFILCGRHSLHVFCLGILLSLVAHLAITELYGGMLLHLGASAAGIAILVGFAWMLDWFRRSDPRTRSAVRVAVGADGER